MKRAQKNLSLFKKHFIPILLVFFVIISVIYVYFNSFYLVSGKDLDFHLSRTIGLIQSIKNHDIFPNINYYMANGLGYGAPLFYGQYFLYVPALLVILLKISMLKAWLALYVLFYVLSLVVCFVAAKRFAVSNKRALFFSLLIVFNPLFASVVSGDLPFAICLVLTPLLLSYLYQLFYRNQSHAIGLAVVASIILNTHILSTVIIAVISLLFVIWNYKLVTREKIISLAKSVVFCALLSTVFLFPLLEQMFSQKFIAFNSARAFRFDSLQGIGTILLNSLNDNIRSISLHPTLTLVGITLLFFSIICGNKQNKFQNSMIKLILCLIVLGSDIFPWRLFTTTPLASVQFVGRYLVFALILIILISIINKRIPNFIFILCLIFSIATGITKNTLFSFTGAPDAPKTFSEYYGGEFLPKRFARFTEINDIDDAVNGKETTIDVYGGEYLNESASPSDIPTNEEFITNNVTINKTERTYGRITLDYTVNNADDSYIVVPFLWYKGYVADYSNGASGEQPRIMTDSHKNAEFDGRIYLKVKHSGTVTIYYKNTLVKNISIVISLVTIVLLLGCLIRKEFLKKPK